jgi:hypothetical protein
MRKHSFVTIVTVALSALSITPSQSFAAPAPTPAIYQATVGPHWPTAATPGAGHRLDCSTANPYYDSNACQLDLSTLNFGCFYEIYSMIGGVAPEPRIPSPAPCRVEIEGPVTWHSAGYCHLYAPQTLLVRYTSQVTENHSQTTVFQAAATFTPTAFADVNKRWVRSYRIDIAGGGPTNFFGAGVIKDSINATFSAPIWPECPNDDTNTVSVGALRDPVPDTVGTQPGATGAVKVTYSLPT